MRLTPILALALLAGCATPAPDAGQPPTFDAPTFTEPAILDPTRSGGEPVMFTSPTGTLFYAAHPGYTHTTFPPSADVIAPSSGTSYLWRSEDDGATWSIVEGVARARNPLSPGVSDPDLAANDDGSLLVMVDLGPLTSVAAAVSPDDGLSWPDARPVVSSTSDRSADRPWRAQLDGTFYLLYNPGLEAWRMRSSTNGIDWVDHSQPGDASYPGAMVVDRNASAIYIGNGDKVWWSEDGGATFEASPLPTERALTGIVAQRPAVDDAGTVYFAWSELDSIWFASSKDHARTWSAPTRLFANGTHIWPWPVAGAAGRLAVVWLGTNDTGEDPGAMDSTWTLHVAMVDAAASATPRIWSASLDNAVATQGGICLNGTICEAQGLDRRLGDFISATIGRTGDLHVGYGTTETGHSISSPAYVRQTGGFRLRG